MSIQGKELFENNMLDPLLFRDQVLSRDKHFHSVVAEGNFNGSV